jgi:hypothetical protein
VLRVAALFEFPPKLVVTGACIGDCGTNNGGDGIEVPILVQPPSTAVTLLAVGAAVPRLVAGFAGQPDALEVSLGVVGQGDVVALEFEPNAGAVAGCCPATTLRVESQAWLAPREIWSFACWIPASTPSRSALPVCETAFCVR